MRSWPATKGKGLGRSLDPPVVSDAHGAVRVDPHRAPGGQVLLAPVPLCDHLRVVALHETDTSGSHGVEPLTSAHGAITRVGQHDGTVRVEGSDDGTVVNDVHATATTANHVSVVQQALLLTLAQHALSIREGAGESARVTRHFVLLGL